MLKDVYILGRLPIAVGKAEGIDSQQGREAGIGAVHGHARQSPQHLLVLPLGWLHHQEVYALLPQPFQQLVDGVGLAAAGGAGDEGVGGEGVP